MIDTPELAEPETEFLFEARVKLSSPLNVGAGPEGHRIIFFVRDGTVRGPRLNGIVVPNSGADWVRRRTDGSSHLDVRFCWKTYDGAIIYVHWHGRFTRNEADAEYAHDMAKPDDPAGAHRYYFRAAPEFETGDARYAWLNNIVSFTQSRTGDGGVIHRFYAVK
jgi:hypothetical protein